MKNLLTFLFFLLTSLLAQAQVGPGLSVGVRGGGNLWLNKQENLNVQGLTLENGYAPTYTGGLVLNYGFSPALSIQPEVLYTQLATQFKATIQNETLTFRASANTLEVPVLLKYSFGEKVRLFVNAGPFLYYYLNAQTKTSFRGETQTEKIPYNSNDGRLTYGAAAGFGASIPLGPGSLLAEGRFNYSLGDNSRGSSRYESMKVLTLSVGYLIPIGR